MSRAFMALVVLAACTGNATTDSTDTVTTDFVDSGTPPARPIDLTILHINDPHSHLASDVFPFDVTSLELSARASQDGDAIEQVMVSYGGMPMLASLIEARREASEHTVTLHAGDAITGTALYSLLGTGPDSAVMNDICFDAFTLGDHEFDGGEQALAAFLQDVRAGGCGTPVVGANLSPGSTSALADGVVEPYTIIRRNGQQIAVVGLTTARTELSSRPDPGTTFSDELTTAQATIDELRDAGIDKVIVLAHLGFDAEIGLARALSGVDLVVGGHSHTLLGGDAFGTLGFETGGDYPTQVTNADGDPVCVVQAWEHAHVLGEVQVSFDVDGVVTSCAGAPWLPVDLESLSYSFNRKTTSEVRTLDLADAAAVASALVDPFEEVIAAVPDTDVQRVVDDALDRAETRKAVSFATVTQAVCAENFPGENRTTTCPRSATFALGSEVANLASKAFLQATLTADVAIHHGGGTVTDIGSGAYTYGDAFAMLPQERTLVTLPMNGQQVRAVLEDALSHHLDDSGSTGSYPYASGLRFDVNASASVGSRISNLEINPRLAGTWGPIEDGATYLVVTDSYLAAGGDGYDAFATVSSAGTAIDTRTEYAEAWLTYAEANPIERVPAIESSTQSYIGQDECLHIPANLETCLGY